VDTVEEFSARLRRVEDELAIQRLILSYGPAADAGLAAMAASVWLEDGQYDWNPESAPFEGQAGVQAMLEGQAHQGLIANGVAHFSGPVLTDIDGDRATALTYSLVMRRDADAGRFYLWRVGAARWDLERDGTSWRARRRTIRLLDESGAGRVLFGDTLRELFDGDGT
jgi:SnoaL-like domain